MKKAGVFSFLVIGFVAVTLVSFCNVGIFLSKVDRLSHSDLIITLSGSNMRVDRAISLLKAGVAEKLAVTTDDAYRLVLRRGVKPSSIVKSRFFATTTYQEGLYIKELLETHQYKNIVIVSDPFHLYRVRWTIGSLCSDSGVRFHFDAPPVKDSIQWWQARGSRLYVLSEISKLVYYWIWHGILQQEDDPSWAVALEKRYIRILYQWVG